MRGGIAAALLARAGDVIGVGGSPDFGWMQWVLLRESARRWRTLSAGYDVIAVRERSGASARG